MPVNYATLIPQVIGAASSIASAVPNAQDKQQRRIAMGGEDPALEAIRRQLAAQNAQTAMSVAASQQGVNPALAQRNAQQALAQQQVQTNSELARMGINSAMQARGSDPKGQKISAALSGIGQFANVLGTGLATQNAGMDAAGDPAAQAMTSALVGGQPLTGGGSPTPAPAFSGSNYAAPAPTTFGVDLPAEAQMPVGADGQPLFDANAPSAAAGVPSAQLQPSGQMGSGVGGLGSFQTPPAATPAAPVAPLPMPGLQLPQSNQVPASQALGQVAPQPTGPSPQGQMVPGQGAGPAGGNLGPQAAYGSPGAASMVPPELANDPQNTGLLSLYEEAVARGDDVLAGIFLDNMRAAGSMSTTPPPITTPRY